MNNKKLILAVMLGMLGQLCTTSEKQQVKHKHPKNQITIVYVEQYGTYFHVWATKETAQKLKDLDKALHPKDFVNPKGNFKILDAQNSAILTKLIIDGATFHDFQ